MVDMGVREQHGVEPGGISWQALPVTLAQLRLTLKESAIDEEFPVRGFKQKPGACHGACGAQKRQPLMSSPPRVLQPGKALRAVITPPYRRFCRSRP